MDDQRYQEIKTQQADLAKIMMKLWSCVIEGMTAQAVMATHLVESTDDQEFSQKVLGQMVNNKDNIINIYGELQSYIDRLDADSQSSTPHE